MVKADELMNHYYEEVQDDMVETIKETVKDELFKDFGDQLKQVAEEALDPDKRKKIEIDEDRYNWRKKHYGNTRIITNVNENFTNISNRFKNITNNMYDFFNYAFKPSIKEGNTNIDENTTVETQQVLTDAVISRLNTLGSQTGNVEANANSVSSEFKALIKSDYDNLKKTFDSHLESYTSLYTYIKSLKLIADGKKSELDKINNKIDTYKQNYYIDGRKDDYMSKNFDFYHTIHFYILLLYFSALIVYFIFSDYFKSGYKNKYTNLAVLFYILFPFIIKRLLAAIYNIYIHILEKYHLLDDDIISYPYIIDDRSKY